MYLELRAVVAASLRGLWDHLSPRHLSPGQIAEKQMKLVLATFSVQLSENKIG